MINGEKIGVGIVTYNRPDLFKKCYTSVDHCKDVDDIIIVNDGDPFDLIINDRTTDYHKNETNLGVGKSKNIALKRLLELGCDHIFLIEDDIFIRDPKVFERYISASKASGIQHFNFSQHGRMNKTPDAVPNPRVNIRYDENVIALYPHCVGAFSYYSRKCLETVGLIDERYYNACEHVDHTYEIIKAGMHPPFWWFADIDESWEYLGDEEWSIEKSTISSNPKHQQMMVDADKIFVEKHGHLPGHTPDIHIKRVGAILKEMKRKYGTVSTNL